MSEGVTSVSHRLEAGDDLHLNYQAGDGQTGLFPQAHVYRQSDNVEIASSPFDLTERVLGGYSLDITPPTEVAHYARYIVYTDAGHTSESASHGRATDFFRYIDPVSQLLAVEYQRATHTAQTYIFVDSVNGSDSNSGASPALAKVTIAGAIAAIVQEHTAIIVLGDPTGQQVITENITLSTRFTFLRGPGLDVQLIGASDASPTISITADGCEVAGFEVTTPGTGTPDAISITAAFARLRRLRVLDAQQHGVNCTGDRLRISECIIEGSGGNGVLLNGGGFALIGDKTIITGSALDNVLITGDADDNVIDDCTLTNSAGGFGLAIGASADRTRVTNVSYSGNSSGDISNGGTDTVRHGGALDNYNGRIHVDTVKGVAGRSYPVGTLDMPSDNAADAKALADNNDIREYGVRGPLTLAAGHDEWRFFGLGAGAEVKLAGQDVDGAFFEGIELSQAAVGSIVCENCTLDGVSGLNGRFVLCGFIGTQTAADGASLTFVDPYSRISGFANTPILDLGAGRTLDIDLIIRGLKGGWRLQNMDRAGDSCSIDIQAGQLVLDATVSDGALGVRGVGVLTDNSTLTAAQLNTNGLVRGISLERVLGQVGHNQVIEVLTKDSEENPLTQRLRTYDSLASADLDDGATGLLDEYISTATWDTGVTPNRLLTYKMTRTGS